MKNGKLVIDEYDMVYGNPGLCCPLRYFEKTFAWNGETFEVEKTEILPNETQHKDYIGYPSDEDE